MKISIKVTLVNGDNWITGFNGTIKEAREYYADKVFVTEDFELGAEVKTEVKMVQEIK
jgi:hypothetical protein